MIISGTNTGMITGNLEETAKFYIDTLGFSIKHRLEIPGCKIYVMENEYTEFDLLEGEAFKPGTALVRVTVRNTDESKKDAEEAGLKQIGDEIESEKMKVIPYTNEDGTVFLLSHHKKVNIYV